MVVVVEGLVVAVGANGIGVTDQRERRHGALNRGDDIVDNGDLLSSQRLAMVRAKTVDLLVPAEAEVVIEGWIDPAVGEPEGPFGESHGHVALEEFNMPFEVSAITHRRDAVVPSYISQVTPSESSVIKRVDKQLIFAVI